MKAPMERLSSTERRGNSRRLSGTWAIPVSTILCGGSEGMDVPSIVISPPVTGRSPEITRSSVVLPAPLAPITATASPAFTCMETPNRAWKAP
jgi:hypothetical protein